MHLVYVDDSGDSKNGTTMTALLVEDKHWNDVLGTWLEGRREIHREFKVPKTQEIHANNLYKGRGNYCESEEDSRAFSADKRAATGRIMLSWLSKAEGLTIVTIATPYKQSPLAYAAFVEWLDDWAYRNKTTAMIFYDGKQGYEHSDDGRSPEEIRIQWDTAFRASTPYRDTHRDLELKTRRVIEDVVMLDSKYNQLIQAADLVAYGAYQWHLQTYPEKWSQRNTPVIPAIRAYFKTKNKWIPEADNGVIWMEERKNP